ncbi:hypothetical protein DMN91_008885 [Ooceraea biroi]|uniref:Double jelly roll-like domain-containing protein n=1 Tax=Ooceraea biroi TaxID=2015173 RepID=A0A3L8DF36_OOCBI|nr:hypothetical protein DMN91_008885 [Ooceraea biroi]
MNNAVFGKTMENVRNHMDVKLVTKWNGRYGAEAVVAKPNFHSRSVFSENLVAIELRKLQVKFNKPIYVGMCIVDISKTCLYEFHHKYMQQDLYTLPCQSFLYVEGKLTTNRAIEGSNVVLGNNCVPFMFDEIRYELDGVKSDRNKNVGMTSTLKNYTLLTLDRGVTLVGFCEDYKRVVINARHELILIRSRNDNNSLLGDPALEPKIELLKIQWRMPHVLLNEVNKLSMLRALESGRYLSMTFRSWDLYEFPLLQSTTKHSWTVKATTQLEKPQYVIFALQTGRKNVMSQDVTIFDDCKLTNVKLYLNSERYPYDDLNLNFERNKYAILYDMYSRFRRAYYGYDYAEAYLTTTNFLLRGPFVVIDCSRQNESIKSATVDTIVPAKEVVQHSLSRRAMNEHIDAIMEVVSLLRGSGKPLEDEEVVAGLLVSLPESYSGLVTALEGRDESDLTIEYVTGKIIDEYQRRIETGDSNTNNSETALKTFPKSSKGGSAYHSIWQFIQK